MIDRSLAAPDLRPGINALETPSHRCAAVHELAVSALGERDGPALWIDARDAASTHVLFDLAAPAALRDLRIARSWTAYQHHELVRRLPAHVDDATALVIVPSVTSLYEDPDVPSPEDRRYLEASLAVLEAVGRRFELPILATVAAGAAFADLVSAYANYEITCERTAVGYRYDAPDFETLVYPGDGFFQTTIPYWVELLGAAGAVDPAVAASDLGLVPAEA